MGSLREQNNVAPPPPAANFAGLPRFFFPPCPPLTRGPPPASGPGEGLSRAPPFLPPPLCSADSTAGPWGCRHCASALAAALRCETPPTRAALVAATAGLALAGGLPRPRPLEGALEGRPLLGADFLPPGGPMLRTRFLPVQSREALSILLYQTGVQFTYRVQEL